MVMVGKTPSAEGVIYDNPYFGVIHQLLISILFLNMFLLYCFSSMGIDKSLEVLKQDRLDNVFIFLLSNQLNNDIQLLLYDHFVKTK